MFGAACPGRGTGAGLVLPLANAAMVSLHLIEISPQAAPGAHAAAVPDGAGWHQQGGKLRVPDNLTPLACPRSPGLNPVEDVWAYLRGNTLGNRALKSYSALVDARCDAWNSLIAAPKRITSSATRPWAQIKQ